ncbi:ATP-binding protein [Actinoplanes sp. DH11]|uniref:ATP-binding protein n=1 Tax=Actinoplanes sp. DH11 TaxID=2857011 RepID=UPI001E5E334A|nr:ATP-binding protein [Actinoplanes sp. DH11]
MTGERQSRGEPAAGEHRAHGHRDRVWDLVSAYGPDVTALCRASTALMTGVAGMGLSAGPAGTVPRIRFFSDTASSRLESAQLTLDEGPCRDATATREPVLVADLAGGSWRQRWPWFTRAALEAGVRAVFALPLHAGGVLHAGAVDLYRAMPGPLNSADQLAATTFTAAATELLTLERHGLNLTKAFGPGWRGFEPAEVAGATGCVMPPSVPSDADGVLLVCWFGPALLGPVRQRIVTLAIRQGLRGDHAYRFVLAVHEAVVNAVVHGGGRGQLLLWRRDGRLWCEISDHGAGMVTPESPASAAGPGPEHAGWSGLRIMRRACTSLDITTTARGTRLLLSRRLDSRSAT